MSELSNVRIGNPTSSEIVALTSNGKAKDSFGAPFYTYVEECIMERFFKHKLENENDIKAFSWGKLCEIVVHELLSTDYVILSEETFRHPTIKEDFGTTDGAKSLTRTLEEVNFFFFFSKTFTETKCPLTRKGFYNLFKLLYNINTLQS